MTDQRRATVACRETATCKGTYGNCDTSGSGLAECIQRPSSSRLRIKFVTVSARSAAKLGRHYGACSRRQYDTILLHDTTAYKYLPRRLIYSRSSRNRSSERGVEVRTATAALACMHLSRHTYKLGPPGIVISLFPLLPGVRSQRYWRSTSAAVDTSSCAWRISGLEEKSVIARWMGGARAASSLPSTSAQASGVCHYSTYRISSSCQSSGSVANKVQTETALLMRMLRPSSERPTQKRRADSAHSPWLRFASLFASLPSLLQWTHSKPYRVSTNSSGRGESYRRFTIAEW